jgi:hypothetical protein
MQVAIAKVDANVIDLKDARAIRSLDEIHAADLDADGPARGNGQRLALGR